MEKQTIKYTVDEKSFKGLFALDPSSQEKRPGVLVAHAWRGRDAFAQEKAQALSQMGYIGFAIDLYGDGLVASSNEQASSLMLPLFKDRKLLRRRMQAAYNVLCEHPLVDKARTGAIGFCFGGLAAIELLKSGLPLCGVVTFHAVLGSFFHGTQAQLEPMAPNIKGALLVNHGHEDPLVSREDITALQSELTQANVDWQFNEYGHAVHAFTNPEANEEALKYNAKADSRSWQSMKNFFKEHFE